MPVELGWQDVAVRLALTVVAGLIIGFNRGEHGRPAGMRTTLLVCLAASLSMIQANLLLGMAGRHGDSFIMLDLMRLPLGILSGMGFIGAGTILRKGDLILGVTTAATLWFATMMGLCFGGGQLWLGVAALVLGSGTLWGLKWVEGMLRQDMQARVSVLLLKDGPTEEEIRAAIVRSACRIISWGVVYIDQGRRRELCVEIQRRTRPGETEPPGFVAELAQNPNIERIGWQPQGARAEGGGGGSGEKKISSAPWIPNK